MPFPLGQINRTSLHVKATFPHAKTKRKHVRSAIVLISIKDNHKCAGHFLRATFAAMIQSEGMRFVVLLGDGLHKHNLAEQAKACSSNDDNLKTFLRDVGVGDSDARVEWLRKGCQKAIHKPIDSDTGDYNSSLYLRHSSGFSKTYMDWFEERANYLGDKWLKDNQSSVYLSLRALNCDIQYNQWFKMTAQQQIMLVNQLCADGKINFEIEKWRDWEQRFGELPIEKQSRYQEWLKALDSEYQTQGAVYKAITRDSRAHLGRDSARLDLARWRTHDYLKAECSGLMFLALLSEYDEILYPSTELSSLGRAREIATLSGDNSLLWTKIKHSEGKKLDPMLELKMIKQFVEKDDWDVIAAVKYRTPFDLHKQLGISYAMLLMLKHEMGLLGDIHLGVIIALSLPSKTGDSLSSVQSNAPNEQMVSYLFQMCPRLSEAVTKGSQLAQEIRSDSESSDSDPEEGLEQLPSDKTTTPQQLPVRH